MTLTDDHIEFIKSEIDKSAISIPELKDDLVDHFCCIVEHEIKDGMSFEDAYARAFNQVCPRGFDEIQKETIYMLNLKKTIIMKKLMYTIGLIASICICFGWLFILMHWPGGHELFTYGFFGFIMLFLPMVAIDRYKLAINAVLSEKLKFIFGFSSAIIVGVAVLFKMMHYQGASILLVLGALLFAFGFLPFLFFRMYKKSVE